MPDPRARAPWLTAAATATAVLCTLVGCTSTPHVPTSSADSATAGTRPQRIPFTALRGLARDQEGHAVRATMDAAPPPGLETSVVAPKGEQPAGTPEALDAAIARLAAARPTAPARSQVSPDDADAALHLYISGREKSMNRNLPAAIADLRKAVELDAGAGEAWRELGEAQAASGFRTDAQASFERALACGLEDARVLERLGRAAAERGDHAAAASVLARASVASPERSDPVLPMIIEVALSRALAAQGQTAPARDAMLRALSRSMQISASTRYGEDMGNLFRRQGELWRELGDMSCRLGDYDRAIQAYERSVELPTLDSRPVAPRLVFASLRAGRPAAAALAVLDDAADENGRLSDEQTALLGSVARAWPAGAGPMTEALDELRKSLPTPVRPSVAGGLALARAAVAPPDRRAAVLREYLDQSPRDTRAMTALFETAPDGDRATSLALDLVTRAPASAGRAAEALLRSRFGASQLRDAALAGHGPEARSLLAVRLLLARGEPIRAAKLTRTLAPTGPAAAEGALCRVEAGIRAGDMTLADEGLRMLASLPDAQRARARALTWFQRNQEALDTLAPLAAAASADIEQRIEDLLLAAELAMSLQRGDQAEGWLKEAIALDDLDDRAPSRLLSLYGPGGPKAESGRFNQAIRDLRRTNPECRTLRGARAKELLRRALLDQAQDEAMRLAQEDPSDAAAIDLLLSVWKARAAREGPESLAGAKTWLEGQLARRPGAPSLLAGLAVVLVTAGEPQEAESRVRAAIAADAGPDASRILERVLREDLKRPQEGDALTMQRLSGRARLPGDSLELAECYARNNDDAKAARAVLDAFPGEVTIAPDQMARAVALASGIAQRAIAGPDPARRSECASLLDLLTTRGVTFTTELHERRLQLLALMPDADAERVLDAAAQTAAAYPNLGVAPYVRASEVLTQANRGAAAVILLAKAADRIKDPPVDLFVEWTRAVAAAGTPAHGRALIEKADAAGRLKDLIDRFEGPAAPDAPARNLRAEAAYFLGNLFSAGKRPDQADGAYELALTYDPNHAWSLNNLGYSILERGGDMARASQLLERAHESLPNEGSITDSLGWLRYKQAIIDDERDASGVVSRRGAVSLLQAAAMTDRGRDDPTILNHLADSLWLAGRGEEARRYWQLSEQLVSRMLVPRPEPADTQGGGGRNLTPAEIEEFRSIKESASTKRRAAAAGQPVHVAPQLNNPDPKPAARPDSPAKPDAPTDKTVDQ